MNTKAAAAAAVIILLLASNLAYAAEGDTGPGNFLDVVRQLQPDYDKPSAGRERAGAGDGAEGIFQRIAQ